MLNSYKVPDDKLVTAINNDLARFAKQWLADDTVGSHQPVQAFCDGMLRGGKRLRGMLAMQSYWAHGGQNQEVALGAARIFEIIQTSLLVVDDIADRSRVRRGGPSGYVQLEAYARQKQLKIDPLHYGQVQAMNVAYAGQHKASLELFQLPVSAEVARQASQCFHEDILTTISGQIDDIDNEAAVTTVSEAAIESVLKRKAAYYTVLSPIELGAALAGKGKLSHDLKEYALNAGCAFQIADDIISTFGHEDETGKGSNDDIREGKVTLLVHYSKIHATDSQKKQLLALGQATATNDACDAVRAVMKETGALAYAKKRSREYEAAALQALKRDTATSSEFKTYLETFADYIVNRRA